MGVYHFQFHQCDGAMSDVPGDVPAATLADARRLAVERARAIMADEVRQGRLCLSCWIVILDERGNNMMTVQFGEAITLTEPDACGHEAAAPARPPS